MHIFRLLFVFGGYKTALMASSNMVLRLASSDAEHSRYFLARICLAKPWPKSDLTTLVVRFPDLSDSFLKLMILFCTLLFEYSLTMLKQRPNEFGSMTTRRSNKIRKVKTTKRFKLRYFMIQIFKTCEEKDLTYLDL